MSKLDELTAAIESRNIEQIRICDIARAVEREEEDHAARLRDFEEKRKEREQAAAWRQHEHAEASEWRRATLEHLTELNRMLGKILCEVRGGK